MNIKITKSIYIVLLIITIMMTIPTSCYAFGGIANEAKGFLGLGNGQGLFDKTALKKASDVIYNVLLGIAIIIAIGVGAFLGIQLMMQGAEGKAQIKEALLPYVIGCTAAFAAFGIWKVVVALAQNLEI